VGRKREEEAEKSESVVGYIALCEDKWRLLTTQAFNNIGLLNNIHGLVQRLYTYCSNTNESWKESDKELGSLKDLEDSIRSLSKAVGVTIDTARRVEESVVGAMERKNERDLKSMKAKTEEVLKVKEVEFHRNVNRLKQQHESFAQEVAQSQNSYSAMQQAADEIRAKLAGSTKEEPKYKSLGDVQLDIKIDKKFRVKDIE